MGVVVEDKNNIDTECALTKEEINELMHNLRGHIDVESKENDHFEDIINNQ